MKVSKALNKAFCKSASWLKRSSPAILTCIASVGVAATAVMAVKATPKAIHILEDAELEKGEKLTKFEVVKTTAAVYIPAAAIGLTTISCIWGAHILNRRQQAALIGAYTMLNNSYKKYREKTKELFGDDADKQIYQAIAKDKYIETIASVPSDEKQLYYDAYYGDYYEASREDVLTAEHWVNEQIAKVGYVSLNDFYKFLGLPGREEFKAIGWSYDMLLDWFGNAWIDFYHDVTVLDDGLETTYISMSDPLAGFMD